MDKHAYLIMAYNNPEQLLQLISLLDDPRNDIYIHIDADSNFPMEVLEGVAQHSGLTVTERVPVRWADYSQTRAELLLLRRARDSGTRYRYYHLLSGMDLPIKTQDEIHRFFAHQNAEFIGIVPTESQYNLNHVRYRYPLLGTKAYRRFKAVRCTTAALVLVQKLLNVNIQTKRNREGWSFYDGWTWFSITDAFAAYLLSKTTQIEQVFPGTKASDEKFMQTVAYNSPFRDRLYDQRDLKRGSMRYIDWKRGTPYVFRSGDFEELMASDCLFARKFDAQVDRAIIQQVCRHLKQKERGETHEG